MEQEIEIIDNEKELRIIIPRAGHWGVIFCTGAWCLIWIFIFYSMVAEGLIFRYSGLALHMGAFAIVWILILRIFLWHVRGKEKVTLDAEHLKIKRLGTFLSSTRRFEINLIDDFRFTENDGIVWWSKLYGFGGGQITFDHWERPEYFGQTVGKKDAQKIASRLNERIKNTRIIQPE